MEVTNMAYLGEMNQQIDREEKMKELQKDEPKTLWDMFQEYINNKEKVQQKKMVELI